MIKSAIEEYEEEGFSRQLSPEELNLKEGIP
jgi:hypothetical protein